MPKIIIFCADGTWNGPADETGRSVVDGPDDAGELLAGTPTNVLKLYTNLAGMGTLDTVALANEHEKICADATGVQQVAKYLHGVGDSNNPIVKLLGGAFGMGVVARIVRGFTYISRNYEAGDRIFITGFSRGAYTARALAGMITKVGLLDPTKYDPGDKEEAYKLGVTAWVKAKTVTLQGAGKLTAVAQAILNFMETIIGDALSPGVLIPNVPIECVAVWDTVGAMGIPAYFDDSRMDMFRFVDTKLAASVSKAFHAMAVNERRIDFPVTRWDADARVTQVWFVGAHADVGGGYPPDESRLSDVALAWMAAKLGASGLKFAVPPPYVPNPQVMGQAWHTPWNDPPFNLAGEAPRKVLNGDTIHASLRDRWNGDAAFRPDSMTDFIATGIGPLPVDQ